MALEVIRHHRLLELFLAETLQMPWDRVHAEAEVLEHVLSEELEAADRREARRPHSSTPTATRSRAPTCELREPATRSLEQPAGGRRQGCSCASPTPTRRCCATSRERGISPGDRFEVLERQPFGGPLFVSFGGREHPIGGQLAHAMRVELDRDREGPRHEPR